MKLQITNQNFNKSNFQFFTFSVDCMSTVFRNVFIKQHYLNLVATNIPQIVFDVIIYLTVTFYFHFLFAKEWQTCPK